MLFRSIDPSAQPWPLGMATNPPTAGARSAFQILAQEARSKETEP